MMRETADEYLVAAATDEEERTLNVPTTFLPEGTYKAQLMLDGDDAHYLTNRESYQVKELTIKSGEEITMRLAPGGGACLRISKN